jgi:hypothetical protein
MQGKLRCIKCNETFDPSHFYREIAERLRQEATCHRCDPWFFQEQMADFLKHGRPTNDEEFAQHMARLYLKFDPGPWTDALVEETAAAMAVGGFGLKNDPAEYGRAIALDDMCQRALRSELGKHKPS